MSKTLIADIRSNAFPDIEIPPGTFVVWRNLDPDAHSAETLGSEPNYFNAGAMLPGQTSSPILFQKVGSIDYLCRFHTGMTGRVVVSERSDSVVRNQHDHGGHGGHGLQHFHGFVTGGRSAERIYMSHTPVLADERHNYQVILQGRFINPAQGKIYEELRQSDYGHGLVQIFHNHVSMPGIGTGVIKELPHSSVSFYPNGRQTDIPGLEEDVRIALDHVIHFHQFATEADYPPEMTYLIYGDQSDIFIDHLIDRAPSFHSVAKLASPPKGWSGNGDGASRFTVSGKRMRDIPAFLVNRAAIVDNGFHLFWLLRPGFLERQAQDPLIRRGLKPGEGHVHDVVLESGNSTQIEIERFLHFDIRLLNYGVLIT